MRAAFLGTPSAAVPALRALARAGHEIPIAVTRPDRPVGRRGAPQPPPVKRAAEAMGIDVLQPERARDGRLREALARARPEILVVVAYGKILPGDVVETAPHGAVNVHFSLLPAYRGAAPVQWALARGEPKTGVTTMRIEAGLDTGAIYLARETPIEEGEHAPALEARLADLGAELLLETLDGIAAGSLEPRPQDDALASEAPRLTRRDGEYDPSWTAREIEGRVRGFDPWPGVSARVREARLVLREAVALAHARTDAAPGTVVAFDGEAFHVACAGGTVVAVRAVQPEGRRRVSARDARNGRTLLPGDLLEPPSTGRG